MGCIMWTLIGIFIYLAIGYIFVLLMDMCEYGFWDHVSIMLLWPVLVILFCICCIYWGCKELYSKYVNMRR